MQEGMGTKDRRLKARSKGKITIVPPTGNRTQTISSKIRAE